MKLDIKNIDGKVTGSIELSDSVFGAPKRVDLLARVIAWQLAKRRGGNHATKGISQISGTTKKPFAQKGGGRARQGSLRSAQMRGGAVIFGPVVRSHAYDLQKKVRQAGLRTALSVKAAEGKLFVLDTASATSPKTKPMAVKLKAISPSLLVIDGANIDENFALATRNIPHVNILPEGGANVYDIMRHDTLALTTNAVEQLTARLQTKAKTVETAAKPAAKKTAAAK